MSSIEQTRVFVNSNRLLATAHQHHGVSLFLSRVPRLREAWVWPSEERWLVMAVEERIHVHSKAEKVIARDASN